MRARFFELHPDGHRTQTIYCDQFPAFLAHVNDGEVGVVSGASEAPVCVFEEQNGNLVLTQATEETFLNGAPIREGGIAPGDHLKIGRTSYVVSYERHSSADLPEPVFRISDTTTVPHAARVRR